MVCWNRLRGNRHNSSFYEESVKDKIVLFSIIAPFVLITILIKDYLLFFINYNNLTERFPIFEDKSVSDLIVNTIIIILFIGWFLLVGNIFRRKEPYKEDE